MRAPDPAAVAARLPGRTSAVGRVLVFDETGSTQDEVRALALQGAPAGTLVLARRQTAGRGRSGRVWASPPGGLYASLLLRPAGPPETWPSLAVVAGVAVVEAIRDLGVADARLKWPNDCRVGDRKLAGLLSEAVPEAGAVLLGLGLNVAAAPVPADVADLAAFLGDLLPDADPDDASAAVLGAMATACSAPAPTVDPGRAGAVLWTRGVVRVAGIEGRVLGVAPGGALVIEGPEGRPVEVTVGEVDDHARGH